MSQYVNISAAEMRQFLRADKGWREFDGPCREFVYVSPIKFLPNNTVLKVYTGINKHNDRSRAKGNDAIRVCVVEDNGHGRGIMATSHVKRVHNWRANLIARITQTLQELRRRNTPAPTPEAQTVPEGVRLTREFDPEVYEEEPDPYREQERAALSGTGFRVPTLEEERKSRNLMTEDEIKQGFMRLASELSPENLTCDGELSKAQVQVRYNRIMEDWKRLEKALGRQVSQDEVWGWIA